MGCVLFIVLLFLGSLGFNMSLFLVRREGRTVNLPYQPPQQEVMEIVAGENIAQTISEETVSVGSLLPDSDDCLPKYTFLSSHLV